MSPYKYTCARNVVDDDAARSGGSGDGSYVTAALGNTWSHCVNTRLIVQYLDDVKRQVRIPLRRQGGAKVKAELNVLSSYRYQISLY